MSVEASAPCDRRRDRHDVAVGDRCRDPAEKADVLVVEVDVDEPVERAVVGDESATQPIVATVEVGEKVFQRLALAVDGLLPAGVAAEDGRDTDFDGHGHILATDAARATLQPVLSRKTALAAPAQSAAALS